MKKILKTLWLSIIILSTNTYAIFTLDANGITINCDTNNVGETGVINGITYTKISDNLMLTINGGTVDSTQACTSGVTSMYAWFYNQNNFNQDISHWDVSSVTNMSQMFYNATNFDQNIVNWDVSSVTNMSQMFYYAPNFSQNIGTWNVSSVTNMSQMFSYATNFNQNIELWNVSSVTDMSTMFDGTTSFNQNLASWDVSSVIDMTNMFRGVTLSENNYNSLLSGWSVLTLQNNVIFSGGKSKYTSVEESARNNIINNSNWTITDGGKVNYNISIAKTTDGAENNGATPTNAVYTITVNPTNNTGSAITGNIAYSGTATNGTDFSIGTINFAIANGSSTATITLNVTEDTLNEGTETAIATISSPSVGSIGTASATANITDDDNYSIAIAKTTDGEENGAGTPTNAVYTVTLSPTNNTGSAITGTITYSGTATNGTDFSIGATNFSIANGQSTATITLAITEDTVVEGTETVIATISPTSIVSIVTASATANIIDDDFIPTLTTFSTFITTTNEDREIELKFVDFTAQGNEADVNGVVNAFIVQTISSGTLKIGASSSTAIVFNPLTNNEINATQNAYWRPDNNTNGLLTIFRVKAKDNNGETSNTAVQTTISVTPINDAPLINTIFNNLTIKENNGTKLYDINISDIDLNDLNLTIESNNTNILTVTPNWSGELNSSNWIKNFNITTVNNANGIVKITIRTTDGEFNTTKTFNVNVTAVDYPPVLEAIGNINKNEDDSSFTISLNATDRDGDKISYTATSSNKAMATVTENNGVLTIRPIANAHGVITIKVVALAKGKSDTKSFKVNIASINDLPTITINTNIKTDTNKEQTLSFNYTDVDGDSVAVTTTKDPENGTVTINNRTITYTPNSDFSGTDSFILSFDDGNGGIVNKTIVVVVNTVNNELNITLSSLTHLISDLKDSNVTVDKKSGITTVTVDSNVTKEIGFVYRAIVLIDKSGKSNTRIVRVNLDTKKETLINFTLKKGVSYKDGNNIKISIKNGMLQIKIVTKINESLIIN